MLDRIALDRATVYGELEAMLDELYGFALNRLRNREEAEELVQSIAVEVLRSWTSVTSPEVLRGWIWSIARYTYIRVIRTKTRDRAFYISIGLPAIALTSEDYDPLTDMSIKEHIGELRREIALLARSYRDVVVMYHLRGRSYCAIAQTLGLPLSTVKWRLHDARRMLEEGLNTVREFGELSYSPKKLFYVTYGNWSPYSFMSSLLRQNIFVATYKRSVTVSDLAVQLGVATAFIEDEVAAMVASEALQYTSSNKIQTSFILHTVEAHKAIEPILIRLESAITPILDQAPVCMQASLPDRWAELSRLSWDKLLPIIVPDLIYSSCDDLQREVAGYSKMPKHADGNAGWASAWEEMPTVNDLSRTNGITLPTRFGKIDQVIYWNNSRGWEKYLQPEDLEFVCDIGLNSDDGVMVIPEADTDPELDERLSRLIGSGHLVREHDSIRLRFALFTKSEKEFYDSVCKTLLDPIKKAMEDAHLAIVNTLGPITPAHLHDQVPVLALCLLTDMPTQIPWNLAPDWPYGMRAVVETDK